MALDVYGHEDLPFEMVVQAVAPQRTPGLNPLFQVNLRVSTARRTLLQLPGLKTTRLGADVGFTRFDLALDLQVLDGGIDGYFRYNREMFDPHTIAGLASQFSELTRELLARPDDRLLSFELPERPAPELVQTGGIRGFRRGRRG
jgi:non-ribosomal peptide synthetase component F